MSSLPVLHLVRLHKAYRAGLLGCTATLEVLRGITLRVMPGELVTVEAPRAGGKTTLLFCAAGLLRPDAGGVDWPALPRRESGPPAGIGYAADRAPPYGFLTAREALVYAATMRNLHEPRTACNAEDVLALCGLAEVADVRAALLGPAHQARLALAAALIPGPKLLLVDDLAGGPGPAERASFIETLGRIASAGVAIVWACRTPGPAGVVTASYALRRGRLMQTGPGAPAVSRRIALELDVAAPDRACDALYPLISKPAAGNRVRVSLDGASSEEVMARCREAGVGVLGSRVVREGAREEALEGAREGAREGRE